jgi:hypothetical protein
MPAWAGHTTGDVVGFDINLDANTFAFNKNNGAWSAATTIPFAGPFLPGLCLHAAVDAGRVRTSSTAYAPPSGAIRW